MQKNSNRSGWALTAVVSLVASLFGAMPAQATLGDVDTTTNGKAFAFYADNFASGAASSSEFVGTLVDDFPVFMQSVTGTALSGNPVFLVEKISGTNMDVFFSATSAASDISGVGADTATSTTLAKISAGSTSATLSPAATNYRMNFKAFSTSDAVSWSPVTLRVTAWFDSVRADGIVGRNEAYSTQTITLLHPKDLTAPIVISPMISGSALATASATVTGVNLANLSGTFVLDGSVAGGASYAYVGSSRTAAAAAALAGVVSGSAVVAVVGRNTVSAVLTYNAHGVGVRVGATQSFTVPVAGATSLTAELVQSDDADTVSGSIRPNRNYSVEITALSGSATVSGLAVSLKMTGPALSVAGGSSLTVGTASATTSYPTALALTTGTDGTVGFTFGTTGVGTGQNFVITVTRGELESVLTLTTATASFTVSAVASQLATTPGTAVAVDFEVEDQWGVASDRTNQRLVLTNGGSGFTYATTISNVLVTAGKATYNFTPSPATKTGSATVTAQMQTFNADTNLWTNVGGTRVVTVNVTDKANAFTGSALASVSASISYDAKYSWSGVLTIKVENAGTSVVVAVPNTVIEDNATSKTYSNTVTLRANASGEVKVRFASAKAGTHVVTSTNGTATTTSQFIVSAAVEGNASSITLPTLDIVSGQTTTITGVLADKNGNPVETDTKDVTIRWTGKGLPFNVGNVSTDDEGKFSFQVLVLAGETGTGTATVTFKPTAKAADDISVVKAYTIAAPAAVAGPEINAVIGTFNGRWAVRVENAKGAVVSVKVGNRWVKYTSLNDNYLFSRKSRVGATLPVAVYVNGQLENVATITIK